MQAFISIIDIMSHNPISLILTINKSTGTSYVDWKRNLDIVLTLAPLKRVAQEIAPFTPNEHLNQEKRDNYHSW